MKLLQFTTPPPADTGPTPDEVLDSARDAGLTEIVISGRDKDGNEFFASAGEAGLLAYWLLARAQHRMMMVTDQIEAGEIEVPE